MPSPEEILRVLREESAKEKNATLVNTEVQVMAIQDLINEKDPAAYRQKAYDILRTYDGSPAMGSAVCSALLNKGEDGLKASHQVGKEMMRFEMSRYSPGGGAFIRGQHSVNGFTKQFIDQTSPDYVKDVQVEVEKLRVKHKTALDNVETATVEQNKEATIALGKDFVKLLSSPPLTDESTKFLKGLRTAIEEDEAFVEKYREARKDKSVEDAQHEQMLMADVIVNNATALRYSVPQISTRDETYNSGNTVWVEATKAAQQTFSKARSETMTIKVPVSNPKTPEEIKENQDFTDVAMGIHESRGEVVELHNSMLESPEVEATELDLHEGFERSTEERELLQNERLETAKNNPEVQKAVLEQTKLATAQKLADNQRFASRYLDENKDLTDKLKSLEKKLDGLNKPWSFERFKAAFTGGVEKVKEQTIARIDQTKIEIFAKTDERQSKVVQEQNQATVEKLQGKMTKVSEGAELYESAQQKLDEANRAITEDGRLKASKMPPVHSEEQIEGFKVQKLEAEHVMETNKVAHDKHTRLKSEVANVHSDVTVREALGKPKGEKVEAPKKSMGVK